jgi:hypothetical protein
LTTGMGSLIVFAFFFSAATIRWRHFPAQMFGLILVGRRGKSGALSGREWPRRTRATALVGEAEFQDRAEREAINGTLTGRRGGVAPLEQSFLLELQNGMFAASQDFGRLLRRQLFGQIQLSKFRCGRQFFLARLRHTWPRGRVPIILSHGAIPRGTGRAFLIRETSFPPLSLQGNAARKNPRC